MALPKLDRTYFESGISQVPNLDDETIDIAKAIGDYSKGFYANYLGYDLYKQLEAAVYTDTTTEFYKLVYGSEYTVDGIIYKWDGLFNSEKQSPLADHVWLNYMPTIWVGNTPSGAMQGMNEELRYGNTRILQARVELHREEQIRAMYAYIYNNDATVYDNIKQFITTRKDEYPNHLGI
jgi:hypothetical protein